MRLLVKGGGELGANSVGFGWPSRVVWRFAQCFPDGGGRVKLEVSLVGSFR